MHVQERARVFVFVVCRRVRRASWRRRWLLKSERRIKNLALSVAGPVSVSEISVHSAPCDAGTKGGFIRRL